ncbi:MAG: Stk1 family PASTA domain-containing Ser/Thr kinase [Anaerolineae bacterium]
MKPTVMNERYRLIELVGAGGMATVYRGEDLLLEREVAVKFLREPYASDPEARQRFLQEARSAAKLDHPNIVHIYDVGEAEDNHPYIVMELVRGEDLKSRIHRIGPLAVSEALVLARAICAGVGQAHKMGIVHCDLKPQNILVTDEGQVKVADFGIARALRQEEGEAERLDVVWGSPHYLSPEQARGQAPTPASDVYSIGVMLFEMLTGVPPFHDQDPEVLAIKHCREEPPPLTALNPKVPTGLDRLVRKVLSKEPAQRFRNADQFGMAIDEYLRQGLSGTRPYSPVAGETPIVATREPSPVGPQSHGGPPVGPRGEGTQPVSSGNGGDATLWMLILIAATAVIGLVPLWIFVYRAYTAPAPVPPTRVDGTMPAPTQGTEALVTVPNLASLSAADAQRLAESLGLSLEVLGEQETSDARPGAVLEQTPGPGNRVPTGSTVSVILAAGRAITMPDVVGYDIDTVESGLESQGLLLEIDEVRSSEMRGMILDQEPDAESEIRVGDTITLTVSGGGNVPISLGVNLNNQVILQQAWVSQFTYRPGDSVPVTLRWRCVAPFDRPYKVFVHLLTEDGSQSVAQQDIEPLRPTTSWEPGDIINDPHQVVLPENTPAGRYQVRVGLYDDQGRLPVVDAGETQAADDMVFVTTVTVVR